MRSNRFLTLAFFFLFCFALSAQQTKSTRLLKKAHRNKIGLSANIPAYLFGLNAGLEYGYTKENSILLFYGEQATSLSIFEQNPLDGYFYSTEAILNTVIYGIEHRFYMDPGRRGNNGLYIAPYLKYEAINSGNDTFESYSPTLSDWVEFQYSQTALIGGFTLGGIWETKHGLYADFWMGLGTALMHEIEFSNGFVPAEGSKWNDGVGLLDLRLGLAVGYRLPF